MKVGIIGLGYWGPNLMRNFATLDGVGLSADQSRRSPAGEKNLFYACC